MSFASDLQGWQSHEALLHMQDYEINLFESMRKCIAHRSKCDHDYLTSLSSIINTVTLKLSGDISDDDTPMGQVWYAVMDETNSMIQLMNQFADQLGSKILDSMVQIVAEKKLLRRLYVEKRSLMDMELDRLLDEVSKCKDTYQRRLAKLVQNRIKYENMWKKGRSSSKLEEVKTQYVRSESKVRNAHNGYLLALCEANLYQQQYSGIMLPSMLDLQQRLQENLIVLCKQVLEQYSSLTDWSKQCFQELHNNIQEAIQSIDSASEYREFVIKHRTDPVQFSKHEFEKSIVVNYLPNSFLTSGQIVVDESTVETMRHSKMTYVDELARCRQRLACKQQELNDAEKSRNADVASVSAHVSTRNVGILRRDLMELRCNEEKLITLLKLIEEPLESVGNTRLHSSISDLSDFGSMLTGENTQSLSTPVISTTTPSQNLQQTLSSLRSTITKKMPFRRSRSGIQSMTVLPSPDTIDHVSPELGDSQQDQQTPSSQRRDETSRTSAAVILDSNTVSRYAESEFVPRNTRPSTVAAASADAGVGRPRTTSRSRNDLELRRLQSAEETQRIIPSTDIAASVTNRTGDRQRAISVSDGIIQDDSDSDEDLVSIAGRSSASSESYSVDNEEWFHGMLPRDDVQSLLQNDGDFLVRISSNKRTGRPQYVLSVQWGMPKHFIIQETPEGFYRLEHECYSTVKQLVDHLVRTRHPVTMKSGVILQNPAPRLDWELRNDDIELQVKIGSGQFGEVFRGLYKPTNLAVAVKTCRNTLDDEFKMKFLQEARILKQYDHPNIVKFIGIASQRHPVMIVMEFVPGGSLLNFLRKYGSHQTAKTLVKMCSHAAAGMSYLASRNCLHRDLAARNCLVDDNCVVKISDFGMSRQEHEYIITSGRRQIPIKWTAPEALNYGTYTTSCDVWSFGVLIWEVFSFGGMPYPGLTNSQAADKINEGYRMPPPADTPDTVYELMLRCWEQEPGDRPTFNNIYDELLQQADTVR